MFWLRNKKIKFSLHTLNLIPERGNDKPGIFLLPAAVWVHLHGIPEFSKRMLRKPVCFVELMLYIPVNNFSVMSLRDVSWVNVLFKDTTHYQPATP